MEQTLAKLHVIVTGAGGGLGPAVVDALRAMGATCHTPTRAELDLTNEEAVATFYASVPALWASVHVAGGFSMAGIEDTSLAAFTEQWTTNTVTAFLASREAVRNIKRTGQGGRIVNVASRVVLDPPGGKTAYVTSKAAVGAFTRAMANEVRGTGILINAVLPDTIDTPRNRAAMPHADTSLWTPPESIARTVAWLASPENRSVSGALVPV